MEPIKFQVPALYELSKTREEGYKKAMVIVGTGLGKTYLSAFDSMNFNKILFIVHRDEILRDAKKTFETIYTNTKSYGFFNGYKKDVDKDITFASISTISKDEYLCEDYFAKEVFDYIVVDEFHHSSAPSYLKLLNYFKPKFLLGLTATPDRADSGDIYKLCDYNIAYECDFRVGINNGWLTPFEYFGIYDDTDYSVIPWRSGKYDLEALENSLIY
ncbi:MAG: DEAD/DEAH box helicase family protein [Cetobacterium sp.]